MTDKQLLVLVRHGESVWNAEGRLQGHLDAPLSGRGRAQVLSLAPAIAQLEVPGERVICSDLGRARETAALLSLDPGRYDPAWREIDLGEWSGQLVEDVDAHGNTLTNWRGGRRTPRAGESWIAFSDRVARAIDALAAAAGSWLVVCHGGSIRAACAHVTGIDPRALAPPPNASISTLELSPQARLLNFGALPDVVAAPSARVSGSPMRKLPRDRTCDRLLP